MAKHLILAALSLVLLIGCCQDDNRPKPDSRPGEERKNSTAPPKGWCGTGTEPPDCAPIYVTQDPDILHQRNRQVSHVENARIEDDCLKFTVYYSGCGPRTTDFLAYWTGEADPIMIHPPSVSLFVVDTLTNMTCEMLVKDQLEYDLAGIRSKISGPFTLNVGGQHIRVD